MSQDNWGGSEVFIERRDMDLCSGCLGDLQSLGVASSFDDGGGAFVLSFFGEDFLFCFLSRDLENLPIGTASA